MSTFRGSTVITDLAVNLQSCATDMYIHTHDMHVHMHVHVHVPYLLHGVEPVLLDSVFPHLPSLLRTTELAVKHYRLG